MNIAASRRLGLPLSGEPLELCSCCRAAAGILLMGAFLCFSQDVFPFMHTTEIHLCDSSDRQCLSKQESQHFSPFLKMRLVEARERMEDHPLRCFRDSSLSALQCRPTQPHCSSCAVPAEPCDVAHCGLAEPLWERQPSPRGACSSAVLPYLGCLPPHKEICVWCPWC